MVTLDLFCGALWYTVLISIIILRESYGELIWHVIFYRISWRPRGTSMILLWIVNRKIVKYIIFFFDENLFIILDTIFCLCIGNRILTIIMMVFRQNTIFWNHSLDIFVWQNSRFGWSWRSKKTYFLLESAFSLLARGYLQDWMIENLHFDLLLKFLFYFLCALVRW